MKKILVSDYDSTFFINDEDIQKNKEMVKKFQESGNIFIIATGRSYLDFYRKVNMYNFDYDYVIINHGATILDRKNNVIANYAMNDEIINKIKKDLQLNQIIDSFCCRKLESRVSINHKSLTKINMKYNSEEEALTINKKINNKYSSYVNSYYVNNNMIEIISNKINKSKAIRFLLDQLALLEDNVYTIGDGYSDIDMIKDFKGYAMANSVDELKKIAIKEYKSVSDLIKDIM